MSQKLAQISRRSALRALLGALVIVFILSGCAADRVTPMYPDREKSIDASQAVRLGATGPLFGAQLDMASGNYFIASGDTDTLWRWYERQVAEGALIYVDETRARSGLHRLFRLSDEGRKYLEVAIHPIDVSTSLLEVYQDISKRDSAGDGGSWLRKAWGFVLGNTEQSLTDWVFGFLMRVIKPIRPIYEKVWLEPVLNSLLALRWLLRWNYALLIVFFALCLGQVTDLVRTVINKPFRRFSWGLFLTSLIMFVLSGIFLAAAIWETLNGFYDTSPGGQAWLQSHIYPFWSDNLRVLAAVPPGGEFLSLRLDQPNLLVVPLLVVIAGIATVSLNMENIRGLHQVLAEVNPREAERLEPFVVLADGMAGEDDAGCNVYAGPLREGAILAFLPVGVAIYFATEKVVELIGSVLFGIDLNAGRQAIEKRKVYRQPTRWVRFLLSFGLMVALIGWIVVVDKGALLEIDSGSRIAGLFVQPVHAVSMAPVPVASTDPSLAPTSLPTSLPVMTATPASQPTATVERATPSPPQDIKAKVTADVLNVRSGPSTGFAVIGKVSRDQEITLLGRTPQSDWLYVSIGPQSGWVAAQYVSADHPIADLPVRQP